ncbi:hypothetical protein OHA98_41835 [Streptomyces sp. NBC_00654]|uniref:hypothetical protein n=1 Tax=Streptomyces sp. NBC_00654 TaxID=2975799 RepID=UPI0022599EB8|nr:hypothetical protein [Streptomyces sp. NBC_00654]MCX4969370.1 hypothetical protein [Streptomyces sp. NBC_00654]MCX4971149.1 hypothetical protein [Streptomyces sp. NBC_00654]
MPRLNEDAEVEVKLDSAGAMLQQAIPAILRRGLFEAPGSRIVAVVEFASTTYTGHAADEDKDPQVKLRVKLAEVATEGDTIRLLREVQRAMYRQRKMNGTLDEIGPGSQDVEATVAALLAEQPTEVEFEVHEERKRAQRGGNRAEQF